MPKITTERDKTIKDPITQPYPKTQEIAVEEIEPSDLNPRKVFEQAEIIELSESIKKNGLIQPITVRLAKGKKKGYEIVCGERRWHAFKYAGIKLIPAMVRELTDQQAMELMVTENLQRKDVHALEECNAFHMMLDKMNYTVLDIAAKMGKPEAFVYRRLQLNELIIDLKNIFHSGILPIGHAELLSRIDKQDQLIWFTSKYTSQYNGGGIGTIGGLREWIKGAEPSLSDARFDLSKIFEGDQFVCAQCTVCPLNSSVHTSLFPDQADEAICHNSHCYEAKDNYTFDAALNEAMENTETIFIAETHRTNEYEELRLKLKADGYTVLKRFDDYSTIDRREPEKWGYETPQAFENRKKNWEAKLKADEAACVKAFIFAGEDRGKYIDIVIKPTVTLSKLDQSTDDKINDLKAKIKRGLELDAEKVMTRLVEHMKVLPETITAPDLSKHEHDCLVVMCYEKSGSSVEINKLLGFNKGFYAYNNGHRLLEAISKASDEVRALIIRRSIHFQHTSILPTGVAGAVNNHLAKDWCPDTLKKFNDEQEALRVKREARLNERIEELCKSV